MNLIYNVMKRIIFILALGTMLFSLQGCGVGVRAVANVSYPPNESTVRIYNVNQILPEGLERIGSVTVGEKGITFSNVTYEDCITVLETEAKKMGGDIVSIVNIQAPDKYLPHYRLTADVFKQH